MEKRSEERVRRVTAAAAFSRYPDSRWNRASLFAIKS